MMIDRGEQDERDERDEMNPFQTQSALVLKIRYKIQILFFHKDNENEKRESI